MLLRKTHDLGDFRLRYLEIVHAADAFAFHMYFQHDLRRSRPFHAEYRFQDVDDKLHRSVVVVNKYDTIQWRLLNLRLRFLDREVEVRASFSVGSSLAHRSCFPSPVQSVSAKSGRTIRADPAVYGVLYMGLERRFHRDSQNLQPKLRAEIDFC